MSDDEHACIGTTYTDLGPKPEFGQYKGFLYFEVYSGNAYQSAVWYTARLGFQPIGFRGLTTGDTKYSSHVLRQNNITVVLTSPLNPTDPDFTDHHSRHGDGVKVVAFDVEDAKAIYEYAVSKGARSYEEVTELVDEFGTVVVAAVYTYGDTVHRFVDRTNYTGPFLPGFDINPEKYSDPLVDMLESPGLLRIDHVVGNMEDQGMEPAVQWYVEKLLWHRFWSVDDTQMHTEFSALRSVVVADYNEVVKMPINEPAPGKRKSQIQEYVDFYAGAGVQHIALRSEDILASVAALRKRGVKFLDVPDSYYNELKKRLSKSPCKVAEDIEELRKLRILIDYDDHGYLLQVFTKPVEDRPTLFFEVIQRRGHEGFGAGNFKALFECIEREQDLRGTLTADGGVE